MSSRLSAHSSCFSNIYSIATKIATFVGKQQDLIGESYIPNCII